MLLGKGRRLSVGHYPLLSLADARKEARRILAEKELGKVRPRYVSWESATVTYLERCERENRPLTVRDYRRILTKRFAFGTKALADIQARDLRAKLEGLPPQEKHHSFTACRSFLRWCVREHYIDATPTDRMETPPQNKPRERILTDAEIKALWAATESPLVRSIRLCGYSSSRGKGAARWRG